MAVPHNIYIDRHILILYFVFCYLKQIKPYFTVELRATHVFSLSLSPPLCAPNQNTVVHQKQRKGYCVVQEHMSVRDLKALCAVSLTVNMQDTFLPFMSLYATSQ